jgi:hypothetical protein
LSNNGAQLLEAVRLPLLAEALSSPKLLADLAGLEQYIAEGYSSRSFIELLQNADDARASRFVIQRYGSWILVANDGRSFARTDLESLCRSAASTKSRGSTIGYRGIGFKSVVSFAGEIYLFSGDLEAAFSRDLTAKDVPDAPRVPLVRIPHSVPAELRSLLGPIIKELQGDGYNTIFAFGDLTAHAIEAEFEALDPSSLLFLRHVRHMNLRLQQDAFVSAKRLEAGLVGQIVRISSIDGIQDWTLVEKDDVAIAIVHDDTGPIRLAPNQATVHAFLSTGEASGLGAKVNGDISTDPSRTRVVLDERTLDRIQRLAQLCVDTIHVCLGKF